jgi:hypothetical protein
VKLLKGKRLETSDRNKFYPFIGYGGIILIDSFKDDDIIYIITMGGVDLFLVNISYLPW